MGSEPHGKPIPGIELAGEVVEIGESVTKYNVNDRVFGSSGLKQATNAEYICISEDAPITKMSTTMSFNEAVAIPIGAQTALYFLRKAKLEKGQNILIYGASGSVGTYAVQLARQLGAKVTGVCSERNIDLVKSIGADKVIDYTEDDFCDIR